MLFMVLISGVIWYLLTFIWASDEGEVHSQYPIKNQTVKV